MLNNIKKHLAVVLAAAVVVTCSHTAAVRANALMRSEDAVTVGSEPLSELDDAITDIIGEHISFPGREPKVYPGASGGGSVYAVTPDGKIHIIEVSLTKAAFTVTDGFDLAALESELDARGIYADIFPDGENAYKITAGYGPVYTVENYLRTAELLISTGKVTHIEHEYEIGEDKHNHIGDLIFAFKGDADAENIAGSYDLDLKKMTVPHYLPDGYTFAMYYTPPTGKNDYDLSPDYSELKRLTENESFCFSCYMTCLAIIYNKIYTCREVIYDKDADVQIPELQDVAGSEEKVTTTTTEKAPTTSLTHPWEVFINTTVAAETTAAASDLRGDANLDFKVSVADAVAILQHIACRDKYELRPQGLVNADVDGSEGVTANDARVLQQWDANKTLNE